MPSQQINSGDRKYTKKSSTRQYLTAIASNIARQTVSILGNSTWGLPLVPQFFNSFKTNNQSDINRLNTFVANFNDFKKNNLQYQGNILPYLTAYSTLQNQGQLNFTRLVGLNLPEFPQLKPGFSLNNNYKMYLMNLTININQNFTNFWNYETQNSANYYQSIILTKDCQTINVSFLPGANKLRLSLTPNNLDNFNARVGNAQELLQKKIFQGDEKPSSIINFDFNPESDNYWKKVLNTNIHRLNDFGYVVIHYTDIFNKIYYENNQLNITDVTLHELNTNELRSFNEEAHYAASPWVVSQGFYHTNQMFSRLDNGLKLEDRVIKLFKIHANCPGEFANNFIIKIIPKSLSASNGWACFDLHLIDSITENVIYEFNDLDLNPDSPDFIGRVIGTEKISLDVSSKKVFSEYSTYMQQNPWIRVELSDDVLNYNILQETIPSGFLGVNKLKNNLKNQSYNILNNSYTLSPQFNVNDITRDFNIYNNKFNLQPKHAWGKNLKDISFFRLDNINNFNKIFKKDNITKTSRAVPFFKLIDYKSSKLNLNRGIEQKNYLNANYYDLNDDNYADMFHLEKIVLLNSYDQDTNILNQFWNYSKYIQSGDNLSNLKSNNIFYLSLFNNGDNIENLYYYYTINKKGLLTIDTTSNIGLDSVEEANNFDSNVNILSFNMEMFGGWDGLNLLDINEYSINDKGLNQSQYLRELYKLGLDILKEEVNGQNEFVYLPEIFNQDVIDYATDLFANTSTLLILDKPFYDLQNEIIYGRDLLTLDAGLNQIEYDWYQQKYKYSANSIIDNLQYSFDNTITGWSQINQQNSNILSFGNYFETTLPSLTNSLLNINGVQHTFLIPSGLFALNSLILYDQPQRIRKMNPIHNLTINSLGEFQVYSIIENSLDHYHPNLLENLQLINNLNINLIHTSIKNGELVYSFLSDKTSSFDSGNNNVLTKINARNTLNDIKKKIKLASYSILFNQITSKQNILNQTSIAYTLVLNNFLNNGLINNFSIKLDETTTSDEDILMGLIRGSIYLQFNNQEIVQIPV